MDLRFGRMTTKETTGDVTKVTVSAYHDFQNVSNEVSYVERHSVKDDKEITAQFLKAMDKRKASPMNDFEFHIIERNHEPRFVEIYWKT